jgi:putative transposase
LTQVEVAKKLGVFEKTLVRWRKECAGLLVDQAKRFKEVEKETIQLKGLVANLMLDKLILKEMLLP